MSGSKLTSRSQERESDEYSCLGKRWFGRVAENTNAQQTYENVFSGVLPRGRPAKAAGSMPLTPSNSLSFTKMP